MHRSSARTSTASPRPAQDELPRTLAQVEEAVGRLRRHMHDGSLSQPIRRKIQSIYSAVQTLRGLVDTELLHLPERSEFTCLDTAMQQMEKRIRSERKRIVIDSDETESDKEQLIGPAVPAPMVKAEDDRETSPNRDQPSTKKKRKRIIHMASSDEEKPPPPKLKSTTALSPPIVKQQPRLDLSDTNTETDDDDDTGSPAKKGHNDASVANLPDPDATLQHDETQQSSIDVDMDNGVNVADDEDCDNVDAVGFIPVQMPATPPRIARQMMDTSMYSGDSSDNDEHSTLVTVARGLKPPMKMNVSTFPEVNAIKQETNQERPPCHPSAAFLLPPRLPAPVVVKHEMPSTSMTSPPTIKPPTPPRPSPPMKRETPPSPVPSVLPPSPAPHMTRLTSPNRATPTPTASLVSPAVATPSPLTLSSPPRPRAPSPPAPPTLSVIDITIDDDDDDDNGQDSTAPGNNRASTSVLDAISAAAVALSSSSDSESSTDHTKKRVSVWHTTTQRGVSSSSSESSSDDDAHAAQSSGGATTPRVAPSPVVVKGALWPNLDKFHAMLIAPAPPPLLPDAFVFPMTYTSAAQYMHSLKQAIVEECLCAFDHKGKSQSSPLASHVALTAISPYNTSVQSLLFRLPKAVSLQAADLLHLVSSTAPRRAPRVPGIAVSTSLGQDDIIVLVSAVYTIDPKASYTLYLVGNLTTGSREYQAALSVSSWPAPLQQVVCAAKTPVSASLGVVPPKLIPALQKKFNEHQFKAIQMAIHQPMTLIQGPPGTGKTHTILGIIQALLHQPSSRRAKIAVGAALGVNTQPKIRLLVTAPSNAAVNVILHKMQDLYPELQMVRLGQPTSTSLVWLEHLIEHDKTKKIAGTEWSSQEARERLLDAAQIVFCTLSGAGSWSMWNPKRSHFDAVIVDEAAQATEASSLIPLRFCAQRYVFVGDHKQLPATILSPRLARMDYDQSLFQRLVCNPTNNVIMLREQYRMHPEISAFPSSMFYCNELVNVHRNQEDRVYHSHGFPPYFFYDVSDGVQSREDTSYRNIPEVDFIATRLRALLHVPYDFKNKIGIISPYKSQIEAIKDALAAAKLTKLKIEVNTVDGFQGREKEILILSCVRTIKSGDNSFWGDVRRMNVSLTRAISSCWVVGNSKLLKESPAWEKLIEDCKRRNLYQRVQVKKPVVVPPKK
ncbi:Aste57867_14850 [Aphanomyces stellatus]|uniref:Aste57867_14850 protein n=1 Tax=Aphanomyces stellatus TaxID=120398 RepID=A0A485L2K8_9STRA|nr:hypothetical protein As57867_014794 [Aphanomyces stellatus]VFT91668.1 Aste57867_14850 [Aphanomyces stellatus]